MNVDGGGSWPLILELEVGNAKQMSKPFCTRYFMKTAAFLLNVYVEQASRYNNGLNKSLSTMSHPLCSGNFPPQKLFKRIGS